MKGRVNRFAAMVAAAFLVGWLHGPVLAEQRQVPEDIAEIKLSFAPIVRDAASNCSPAAPTSTTARR